MRLRTSLFDPPRNIFGRGINFPIREIKYTLSALYVPSTSSPPSPIFCEVPLPKDVKSLEIAVPCLHLPPFFDASVRTGKRICRGQKLPFPGRIFFFISLYDPFQAFSLCTKGGFPQILSLLHQSLLKLSSSRPFQSHFFCLTFLSSNFLSF